MTQKRTLNKRSIGQRFLYKGHVIRPDQIVEASGDASGFFCVRRVWGHHATLDPLEVAEVPEPNFAIHITVQREAHQ